MLTVLKLLLWGEGVVVNGLGLTLCRCGLILALAVLVIHFYVIHVESTIAREAIQVGIGAGATFGQVLTLTRLFVKVDVFKTGDRVAHLG